MKDRIIVVLIILISVFVAAAAIPSRFYIPGLFTAWVKTDTSLSVNVDTLGLWLAAQRRIDSTVAASAGTPQRGEQIIRLHANFSNGANDSTNLAVNVNGVYQSYLVPYNVYLDRFILATAEPDARGPSTFRDDLPPISPDSAIVFRLSRNASFPAQSRAALTAYKIAANSGLSGANTIGVFYDMIRFDEAVFPAAGTSVQTLIHATVKKNR
jgi:hypothetical protein